MLHSGCRDKIQFVLISFLGQQTRLTCDVPALRRDPIAPDGINSLGPQSHKTGLRQTETSHTKGQRMNSRRHQEANRLIARKLQTTNAKAIFSALVTLHPKMITL